VVESICFVVLFANKKTIILKSETSGNRVVQSIARWTFNAATMVAKGEFTLLSPSKGHSSFNSCNAKDVLVTFQIVGEKEWTANEPPSFVNLSIPSNVSFTMKSGFSF